MDNDHRKFYWLIEVLFVIFKFYIYSSHINGNFQEQVMQIFSFSFRYVRGI